MTTSVPHPTTSLVDDTVFHEMGDDHLASGPMTKYLETKTFGTTDYVILVVLTTLSVVTGTVTALRGTKMKTTKDFLLGGRSMHPIPVTLSLLGGVVSALSILGNATEMYMYGTQLSMSLLGCVWGIIIVSSIILPVLYPLELVSMFQYLQMRFKSKSLRKMSSFSQILTSTFFLGICLYTPSLTLSSVTDIPHWASIVFMGLVCTAYIAIGGVRAVVYTDVVQTSLMFIGVVVVTVIAIVEIGGFQNIWNIAEEGGRLEFFNFDPSPFVRHTFWNVQVLGIYFIVSTISLSQAQYQRLVSVKDLRTSITLCYAFIAGLIILWSVFYFSGVVAYATYAGCDPITLGQVEKPDGIIPFMVIDKVSQFKGLAGLFVAAVYGGVLSSVSSQASAISTMVWEDFLIEKKYFAQMSDAAATNVTKMLSAACGLIAIVFAFLVSNLGTLFQVAYTIKGAIGGPLDGLFVTAIIAPWVTTKGSLCGFIGSCMLNGFLLAGKIYYGAGTSEPLPLSIDNCPSEVLDSDVLDVMGNEAPLLSLSSDVLNVTASSQEMLSSHRMHWAIFDLSYCYQGALGILCTFVISSIVSFATVLQDNMQLQANLFDFSYG
ncbi:sodium-coupled monocarboxylate transporter 1-like [Oratosquilla oratoria]|uniref:sodium-coupled monocarboxylate transporter 1-like n=1 Tax=Oratosquilla oratoria TaxID=337810 RepID=UPI003F77645E